MLKHTKCKISPLPYVEVYNSGELDPHHEAALSGEPCCWPSSLVLDTKVEASGGAWGPSV